jgi:hypothetical protein
VSSYTVIQRVSDALRDVLWSAFDADATVQQLVPTESAIVFRNPTETARDSANRLSFRLYQVTENEFVKNAPMMRIGAQGEEQFPPMGLNLFYLLTPFAESGEGDHILLGKTMQVLYDNAILLLHDPLTGIFEELRIVFCRLTLEELTRIWDALREPYRLSVCYEVRVTRIDSQRRPSNARVIERTAGFDPVPSPAGGVA